MVWLRGVAVVEAECPSEPLLPMNNSVALPFVGVRDDQPVVEALMISLCVVVSRPAWIPLAAAVVLGRDESAVPCQ